ncbi:MAG: hypothetical protein U9Q72_02750 [Patescibacteria group bacterium]|nr:hypothetical protein [Patescibacteria group bacterium]
MAYSLENPKRFNRIPDHIFERIAYNALNMIEKDKKAEALKVLEDEKFRKKATQFWEGKFIGDDSTKAEIELAKGLKIRLEEELKDNDLT